MKKNKKGKSINNNLARNKRAFFDYFISEKIEAGVCLEGWEVKAIRQKKINIEQGYVQIRENRVFLFGANITALSTTSTHKRIDPMRDRELLLHKKEITRLLNAKERNGFTILPLNLYLKRSLIKIEIGIGKGKKQLDKRQSQKDTDWKRQQARILKNKSL